MSRPERFHGHERGLVITQPKPGVFVERPMTAGELAAREPAAWVQDNIYRLANSAGACYHEIWHRFAKAIDTELARAVISRFTSAESIDMVLFCPVCGRQHIDAPDEAAGWTNPPHKSHLCHNCGAIWRPADVPTNGVAQTKTAGKGDNFRSWSGWAEIPESKKGPPAVGFIDLDKQ